MIAHSAILGLLILLLGATARAQEPESRGSEVPRPYAQAGFGGGTSGWTLIAEGAVKYADHFFIGRFSETSSELFEGGRTLREFGLLYGRSLNKTCPSASVGLGVSSVTCEDIEGCGLGEQRGDVTSETGLGIPLEVQVTLPITRFFGLGLHGFVNLNGIQSYAGAAVVLRLGSL